MRGMRERERLNLPLIASDILRGREVVDKGECKISIRECSSPYVCPYKNVTEGRGGEGRGGEGRGGMGRGGKKNNIENGT